MQIHCYHLKPGQLFRLNNGQPLMKCLAIDTERESTIIAYRPYPAGWLSTFKPNTDNEISLIRLSMYSFIRLA